MRWLFGIDILVCPKIESTKMVFITEASKENVFLHALFLHVCMSITNLSFGTMLFLERVHPMVQQQRKTADLLSLCCNPRHCFQ